jgi:amylosucrase
MIAVRKSTAAFADYNNRELLQTGNPHLFAFIRSNPFAAQDSVIVVANFDTSPQSLDLGDLPNRVQFEFANAQDLYSGGSPSRFKNQLVVPPLQFYWLTNLHLR